VSDAGYIVAAATTISAADEVDIAGTAATTAATTATAITLCPL